VPRHHHAHNNNDDYNDHEDNDSNRGHEQQQCSVNKCIDDCAHHDQHDDYAAIEANKCTDDCARYSHYYTADNDTGAKCRRRRRRWCR
jgi:hypothetical protein